ncbi:PREDICTED: ankyrin repeat domain-containing protein 39-like [Dinoponera quadriceps]|uniref:Ankyrin repeat domain-containing protein 39-like n=1 Tax=Dinoponera quadriceps TaxID=609295 RepID=A0A6P3X5I4_DINQU|nr:PREDICTED: ankyrin repeat domain-containing protein 39-like [Dinoponera quadriceps]
MTHSHGDHAHDACCLADSNPSVRQTLDEMEFERSIWYAALDDDYERVETLLRNGAPVNNEDSAGYRPLHYAARNANRRICETLLRHGAEVDACTRCGRATALHRAATRGRLDIVELLLNHGADANLVDLDGNTALHRAIIACAPDVCRLLIPHTDLTIVDNAGFSAEVLAKQKCTELLPLIKKYST